MIIKFKPTGHSNLESVATNSVQVSYRGETFEITECDESIDVLSYGSGEEPEVLGSIVKEV